MFFCAGPTRAPDCCYYVSGSRRALCWEESSVLRRALTAGYLCSQHYCLTHKMAQASGNLTRLAGRRHRGGCTVIGRTHRRNEGGGESRAWSTAWSVVVASYGDWSTYHRNKPLYAACPLELAVPGSKKANPHMRNRPLTRRALVERPPSLGAQHGG